MDSWSHELTCFITVELHPYLQQTRLVEWVQKQGIQVTAYSSFGPASFVQLTEDGKTAQPLLTHDVIKAIAAKHNKTTAQILLRWSVQRNVAVIPKSVSIERTRSNIDLFSFSLDNEDMKEIAKLELGLRFNGKDDPFGYHKQKAHRILTCLFVCV